MEKPFRFFILCNKTNNVVWQGNEEPYLYQHNIMTYEEIGNGVSELRQTKTVYIDTRYYVKIRLWNYINYTKKGLEIPRYRPFEGTEIGKSIGILEHLKSPKIEQTKEALCIDKKGQISLF
jgi:hypothetical protein